MAYRVSYGRGNGFSLGPIAFLVIINVVLWVATSIRPDLFINVFGLRPILFLQMPWTIITSMFIHSPFPSIWHILFNMFTLYFFGTYLKTLVGEGRFLVTYFIGGLLGNLAFLFLSNPYTVAIGASGAVYAVAGALTVLRPKMKIIIFPIPIPIPLWIAMIGFVALSFSANIAWQAHIGGILFGLLMGFIFKRRQRGILFNI
ncbi:rhomboid family intramembrane serine protease [Chloroflexota bacterium]